MNLRTTEDEDARQPTIGDYTSAIATLRSVIDGDMPPSEQFTQINVLLDGRQLTPRASVPAPPPQIEAPEEGER